jgi:hypothetical protein
MNKEHTVKNSDVSIFSATKKFELEWNVPTLSPAVQCTIVAYGYHSSINHPLIVEGANASLLKWSAYYDKSSPIVMAVNFMNPRLKMEYFLENGWKLLLMLGKC